MLKIQNVYKTYHVGQRQITVLAGADFEIKKGEFVVLFGPNGCGKTTLLNIVAGLQRADNGQVEKPASARISFVFQNFRDALFPWLKIGENIALPLKLQSQDRRLREKKVRALLEKLKISLDVNAYPYQLSSGQQQLAAILRGIIEPVDLLIMDEPFSSLDYRTALLIEQKLLEFWQMFKFTVLFVTHAAGEAVLLADRILIMSDKPSRIISQIPVELPRPRSYEIITSPEFNQIKEQVIRSLIKGKTI